jgi:hypothetical protein
MNISSALLLVGVSVSLTLPTLSAQTVAVGNCRPHLVSYSTISAAVTAVTPNSTVLVCPGTYPEQVSITQPLTLMGLTAAAVKAVFVQGISVLGTFEQSLASVDLSNLVVTGNSGTGSGAINYSFASGSIENVDVSGEIDLGGGVANSDSVNVKNSSIHDFSGIGISATSSGASSFYVNITSSSITSNNPNAQAGVFYFFADGAITHNTIVLVGGTGLQLENLFGSVAAKGNSIAGANVGILSGQSEGQNVLENNSLFNNGTGIYVSVFGRAAVKSNSIVQSSIAAIDLDCALSTSDDIAKNNTIVGAPVGIANVGSGDAIAGNIFYNVPTATTLCE